jgi:hypothetical protein
VFADVRWVAEMGGCSHNCSLGRRSTIKETRLEGTIRLTFYVGRLLRHSDLARTHFIHAAQLQ